MKSLKTYLQIILILALITLTGCTSSMDYSDTASEGPWTVSLNKDGKDAFATSYVWDGTEASLRIEPGEIEGCYITRYGGYYGRGLPEPFSIVIPNASHVDEKDVPEDAKVRELVFTMVFGSQIRDIFCRQLAGYYRAKDNDGKDIYYLLLINAELSPDNKNFRIENDKLYFKDKDTPIEELYFDGARKEGENMTGTEEFEDMTPTAVMVVRVGERSFTIDLAGNSSAEAFWDKIKEDGLKINMSDYGDFEKVGDLPWSLPTNDEEITTRPGDLILYQGNKITVYYNENTWDFTKLGRLNASEEEIREVFGGKDEIEVEFYLEWTE